MTVFGLQEIASLIEEYGDPETKARVLPRFSRGEVSGAMVLTEADAGSDLGAVATKATLDEASGQWHLNGVKRFITNGLADVSVVLARSEEAPRTLAASRCSWWRKTKRSRSAASKTRWHPFVAHLRDPVRQHAGDPDRQAPLRPDALLHEPHERCASAVAAQALGIAEPPTAQRTGTPRSASSSASRSAPCRPWPDSCSR